MLDLLDRKTITIAKAVVITSVVLGHLLEALLLDGNRFIDGFYHSIYLVHMPFYFILSGLLFKGPQPKSKYLIKKIKQLIVPYIAWLIIFNLKAIVGFGANLVQGNLAGEKLFFYKAHFFSQLYGGMEVHGHLMILWFPTCLFFTQQLANIVLCKFEKQTPAILLIGLTVFTFGYINQFFFSEFHLPLALNVVAGALPLFLLGYYIKKHPPNMGLFWGGVGLCLVTCIFIFVYNYPLAYHMRSANYGVPLLSTFAAIGGFFLVMFLSKQIARNTYLYNVLNPVSTASMTIMYIHALILGLMRGLHLYNIYLLLVIGVLIPTLIHLALSRINVLSKLFLGEDKKNKINE